MNLKEFAKARKEISALMTDREKIETVEVVNQELTLIDFDIVQNPNGKRPYAICIFSEYPDRFLFGGMVLTDLLMSIVQEYGEGYKDELKSCGGLKIKLRSKKSKTKNPENGLFNGYTDVEILD